MLARGADDVSRATEGGTTEPDAGAAAIGIDEPGAGGFQYSPDSQVVSGRHRCLIVHIFSSADRGQPEGGPYPEIPAVLGALMRYR
jgi:hypothetical protein